jgi:molecular chaperone GrpE (heat shock protein)
MIMVAAEGLTGWFSSWNKALIIFLACVGLFIVAALRVMAPDGIDMIVVLVLGGAGLLVALAGACISLKANISVTVMGSVISAFALAIVFLYKGGLIGPGIGASIVLLACGAIALLLMAAGAVPGLRRPAVKPAADGGVTRAGLREPMNVQNILVFIGILAFLLAVVGLAVTGYKDTLFYVAIDNVIFGGIAIVILIAGVSLFLRPDNKALAAGMVIVLATMALIYLSRVTIDGIAGLAGLACVFYACGAIALAANVVGAFILRPPVPEPVRVPVQAFLPQEPEYKKDIDGLINFDRKLKPVTTEEKYTDKVTTIMEDMQDVLISYKTDMRKEKTSLNTKAEANLIQMLELYDGLTKYVNMYDTVRPEGYDRVNTIFIELDQKLKVMGVKPLEVRKGDEFDGNKHVILNENEMPDDFEGKRLVGEVVKPGYALNDKILRPAKVMVDWMKKT